VPPVRGVTLLPEGSMTDPKLPAPARSPIAVPWSATDAVHGIGLFTVGGILTVLVLGRFRGASGAADEAMTTLAIAVLTGLLLAAVWLFAIRRHDAQWRSLGLGRPAVGSDFVLAIPCLTLSIGFFGVYVALVDAFGPDLLVPEPIDADNLGSSVFRVVNVAVVGLIGPFAEEVFFRGFLLTAFVPSLGVFRAAALASAVFAISHIALGVAVPFFVTGLLLSWLYVKTRSIWPPLLAHMAQNVLAIIGMFATA